MQKLADKSVHAIATSVPYWLQRDYEDDKCIGLEPTRSEWASRLVEVMREGMRVLRDDGTAFLVVGETWPTRRLDEVDSGEVSLQAPFLAECLREDGWCIKTMIVIEYTNRTPKSNKNYPVQYHEYGLLISKHKSSIFTKIKPGYFWDPISSRERGLKYDRLARSVWHGSTEEAWIGKNGFKHSSILPQWVIDRYLSAAVSEGGACAKCGTPWVARVKKAKGGSIGKSWLPHGDDLVKGNAKTGSSKGYVPATIIGWKQGCRCAGAAKARPVVLDMFTGTSNVGVVSLRRECDFVGIDLDKRCIETSAERLRLEKENLKTPLFNSEKTSRRQDPMFAGVDE
jgi:hypothetical protein